MKITIHLIYYKIANLKLTNSVIINSKLKNVRGEINMYWNPLFENDVPVAHFCS